MRSIPAGLSRGRHGRRLVAAALMVVAVLVVGATSAQAATGVSFAPFVQSGTGLNPLAAAAADFDGDGRGDLATANYGTVGSVSVLLGNGDATFEAKVDYPVNPAAQSVAVGDFNRDGRPDLAVTNNANVGSSGSSVSDGRIVSVLFGRGDGTFAPKADFATGAGAFGVAVADLNADGNPDMAVTDRAANTVSVLLGRGDGTFASTSDYNTGGGPQAIVVGDLDKDGSPDIVTANSNTTVSVLRGRPNGTFTPRADYPGGPVQTFRTPSLTGMVIGDFNSDGNLDVATSGRSADGSEFNSVSVLMGRGDATFAPPTVYYDTTISGYLAAADFNQDGHLDLAASVASGVSVLLNRGDGTFPDKTKLAGESGGVATGEFNGDGQPDLVSTGNVGSRTVSVLLNTTDVTAPEITVAAPAEGASYTAGEQVTVDYSCRDRPGGGSGLMSCEGSVPVGEALDTSTVGPHTFTVTASDISANTALKTVRYTVTEPAGPPATTNPPAIRPPTPAAPPPSAAKPPSAGPRRRVSLTGLGLTARRMARGSRTIFAVRGALRLPAGVSSSPRAVLCRGSVTIAAGRGRKTGATETARVSKGCAFSVRIVVSTRKLGSRGRYRIRARFAGNTYVNARSQTTTAR